MSRRKGRSVSETVGIAPVQFPPGTVISFAGSVAPQGWLICNGSAISRTDYASLFAAIGTAWGAPDANTFNLPDLRGRFLRGVDGTAGRDPDKASRTAANAGGNTGNAVGSVQGDAMQGHQHNFQSNAFSLGSSSARLFYSTEAGTTYTGRVTNPITDGVNGNPRTTSETRPLNANVQYIIKI